MSLRTAWNGRRYWVTKPLYQAHCFDCDWKAFKQNAKGIAAQHHDRTGHTVSVDETNTTVYQTEESYRADHDDA